MLCGGMFVFIRVCATGEKPRGNEGSMSTWLHISKTSLLYAAAVSYIRHDDTNGEVESVSLFMSV